jgi:hypothetical protein
LGFEADSVTSSKAPEGWRTPGRLAWFGVIAFAPASWTSAFVALRREVSAALRRFLFLEIHL